jgi:hypothetical protein
MVVPRARDAGSLSKISLSHEKYSETLRGLFSLLNNGKICSEQEMGAGLQMSSG